MKRKLLFAVILLTTYVFPQKYLSGSDSLSYFAPQEKYVKVSITDSSDTYTDTLVVKVKDSNGDYIPVGCEDLSTGEIVTELIPGDGISNRYLINEPFPTNVVLERTNQSHKERRTKVAWSSVGSY